jgi:electron transfer flavoprotein alpha subunit
MAEGVLVIGEILDGELVGITREMLGAARRISDGLGGSLVNLALFGEGAEALAQQGIEAGADLVYTEDNPALTEYLPERWLQAAQTAVDFADPAVILIGTTTPGRDLASRLAFRLNTGVAMDILEFEVKDGAVHWTRPCYGGSARAVVRINGSPQIATVRAKSQEPLEPDTSRTGDTIPLGVELNTASEREKITNKETVEAEGIQLEDADIVVSGGRGLGGPEGFQVIENLAHVLGAAVGASRAACDLGWYPPSQQVGLTGKTVSPDLYVAIGISGASQHMSGMAGSKTIVAINKDPDSTMVKSARYALIGDYKQAVPALTDEIKKLKS